MSSSVEKIELLLRSGVLNQSLIAVPPEPASPDGIDKLEYKLGTSLSQALRNLLVRWNGIDIDVLRIHGVNGDEVPYPIEPALNFDPKLERNAIVVASDPSGFLYIEHADGKISSYDTDGGRLDVVARDFDDFLCRFVLGADSADFAGDDWERDLRKAGVIGQ